MTKKMHPADMADREAIAAAVSFTAHLRLSASKKITEQASTLEEAVAKADAIRAAHPSRDVLVYAVLGTGASVPVPKDMQKAARPAGAAEAPAATEAKQKPNKPIGKRAAIAEAAQRGEIPAAPDFSAETHARFRKRLGELVALAQAGDIDGLRAFHINPVSSSPKAMAKYRDLVVTALEARQQKAA